MIVHNSKKVVRIRCFIVHNSKKVVKTECETVGSVKLKKNDSAQDLLWYKYAKSIFSDKVSAKSLTAF